MFEPSPHLKVMRDTIDEMHWNISEDGNLFYDSRKIIKKPVFVIDNFYKDPDKVRQFALESDLYDDKDRLAGAIGRRVWREEPDVISELNICLSDVFKQLCTHEDWHIEFDEEHHKNKWETMRFVVNVTNDDEIVASERWDDIFHVDGPYNKWASLVFLNTPEEYGEENSVPGTGFCTIQKPTKEVPKPKPKLQYVCPMKYNRAILYDANMVHGAIMKPGMYKTYDRLTQIMFF